MNRTSSIKPGIYILLLMACAAAFSLAMWMDESLRLDEAQSVWQTSRDLPGVMRYIAKDVHMPLYFILLHYWEIAFGTGEAAIRTMSLLFCLVSIPAMFYLALRAYTPRVAYFASLLTTVSPFLGWYGSEARMYSMLFLFTALSHLLYINLWKAPSRRIWLLYGIVTFLGLFTHMFFGFVALSQAVFYFARRDIFPKGSLARFLGTAALCAVPVAVWFVYRRVAGAGLSNPVLAAPTSFDFFNLFSNFFIGFQTDAVNTMFLSLWPLAVFAAFTILNKKKRTEPQTGYLMLASLLPIMLTFAVSVAFTPIFLGRYLIVALPSLYLLAIYFLSSYKLRVSNFVLGALCIGAFFMTGYQAGDKASPVKEDYRSVAAYVAARTRADDLLVVSAPFLTYPIEYYYRGEARIETFPRWDRYTDDPLPEPYSPGLIAKDSADWAKVYQRVYVVFGYHQPYEEDTRFYLDTHYERIEEKTFSSGLSLYVYKLRYL
ncbi:MAG TPA: glycosyltransferase family 39 protein [Candidatus Paceibacterota bacterium]|nr:glycosyltransferase family 39 protein [Candidatus Paceibacterota bacterium]